MTELAQLGDRSLFPDLEARAYLNHAAVSPVSSAVRHAVTAALDDYARRGVGAIGAWIEQRTRLRGKLAALIGARPEEIAFVPNTTSGVTDIALCFPWQRRDRVVLFTGEFPANVTPWQRAAELHHLETTFLSLEPFARSADEGLESLRVELARGVRLVAVSLVQFQTGLRMPVEAMAKLCQKHGAQLFVDGIQGVGAVPIDVERSGVDYLACGGHKWLMGLEGAGFLYVRQKRAAQLRPHVAGWLSHRNGLSFLFEGSGHLRYDRPIKQTAEFVEGGAYNTLGYAGLEASVDLLAQVGIDSIHAHANAYLDVLEPLLVERGFQSLRSSSSDARSCILGTIPPEGRPVTELHRALAARGIAVTIPDGVLRFAPSWPNSVAEIPGVMAAIDAV